jgi:hypothetical protein
MTFPVKNAKTQRSYHNLHELINALDEESQSKAANVKVTAVTHPVQAVPVDKSFKHHRRTDAESRRDRRHHVRREDASESSPNDAVNLADNEATTVDAASDSGNADHSHLASVGKCTLQRQLMRRQTCGGVTQLSTMAKVNSVTSGRHSLRLNMSGTSSTTPLNRLADDATMSSEPTCSADNKQSLQVVAPAESDSFTDTFGTCGNDRPTRQPRRKKHIKRTGSSYE